jgi:hypothetical protein
MLQEILDGDDQVGINVDVLSNFFSNDLIDRNCTGLEESKKRKRSI